MLGVSREVTAARRAEWLAELSQALEDAQDVLYRMGGGDVRQIDALDLWARIEAARAQLRMLRGTRADSNFTSEWSNQAIWDRRSESCSD